jgi:hypothetical protein
LVTGIDSPVTIDSSSEEWPSVTMPSTGTFSPRDLLAGAHAQDVADHDFIERDVLFGAIVHAPRDFRRKTDQRADRTRGLRARAQLQHLAEQHQHGDDRGRFEIGRNRARVPPKRAGENAGRERCDDAVEVRDAGAHRDQGEHVEIARGDRLPAAHEERPSRPQHHRRGECELDPVRPALIDEAVAAHDVRAHLEREDRKRQDQSDPEAPAHVGEFGVGSGLGARDLGFERHAADRAGAGAGLADFGVHRTGVDRALRHRIGGTRVLAEIFRRIGGELGPAAGRAEIVGVAAMLVAVLRGMRIDRHAANGIERAVARGAGLVGAIVIVCLHT